VCVKLRPPRPRPPQPTPLTVKRTAKCVAHPAVRAVSVNPTVSDGGGLGFSGTWPPFPLFPPKNLTLEVVDVQGPATFLGVEKPRILVHSSVPACKTRATKRRCHAALLRVNIPSAPTPMRRLEPLDASRLGAQPSVDRCSDQEPIAAEGGGDLNWGGAATLGFSGWGVR